MAFDAFLKLEGIEGESTDDAHKGWIEILNYGFGASHPKAGTPGGHSAGRVEIQDITFSKWMDKASPKLFEVCCSGKAFPTATIELCRAGGNKLKYLEYKLTAVMVQSIGSHGDRGSSDLPVESITLAFGTVEMTYTQQNKDTHEAIGKVSAGWDLQKNAKK